MTDTVKTTLLKKLSDIERKAEAMNILAEATASRLREMRSAMEEIRATFDNINREGAEILRMVEARPPLAPVPTWGPPLPSSMLPLVEKPDSKIELPAPAAGTVHIQGPVAE